MISAVTFCYNEGDKLKKSLPVLRPYVDEVIVYDLESTDDTNEVAKKYTNEVVRVPYMLCGDGYKMELAYRSKGNWLLWFYADEIFSQNTVEILSKLTEATRYNVFAFMRHEYLDNIRVGYNKGDKLVYFGSAENPNYQSRLIKKDERTFYTELVHAEMHGTQETCGMPPEYYMEHRKSSKDQEFDNIRLYIWYKHLIWKYGNTKVEPYKTYVDSYKKIIADSELAMSTGTRRKHAAEEDWANWRNYPLFKEDEKIVDKAVKETIESKEA